MLKHTRYYVILSRGRTGSTWLAQLLDAHPEISCGSRKSGWGELLHGHGHDGNDDLSFKIIADFMAEQREPVVGFKLLYGQMHNWVRFGEFLGDMGFRTYIHLIRKNALDIMVSVALTKATHVWHVQNDTDPWEADSIKKYNDGRIVIDPDDVVNYIKHYGQVIKNINYRFKTHMFYYEDLLKDGAVEVQKLLGVDPISDLKSFSKLRRVPKSKTIANFKEVSQALAGTEHEWMLEG